MTRLLLIRHGHSVAQEAGRLTNHDTCSGLSDTGRLQAERLAERLRRTDELVGVDALHTSLLARAQETAAVVADAADIQEVHRDCSLCELHPGDADGLTWAAMVERWPAQGDKDDPYRRRLPGMETWSEMTLRVGATLRALADERPRQTSVIVASGGPVGASFAALGDLPISHVVGMTRATRNTSITEWALEGSHWQLQRFNDDAHLRW